MSIRIGIVDDHPTFLLGLEALLRTDQGFAVVASGAHTDDVLAQGEEMDVVLLDLSLNDGSDVDVNVQDLRDAGCRVVAFTSGDQPHLIREATRAGVAAVVRKSEAYDALARAIRACMSNDVGILNAEWAAALESDRHFVKKLLSLREAEVLALYAAGETAARVGQILFISEETVIEHIKRVRKKYAEQGRPARSKIDLFRRAVEDGLIVLD